MRRRWSLRPAVLMSWLVVAAGVACLACSAASAQAATSASWQYAPAQAPPPPAGVAASPLFPANLGQVGDIEFWAPNEGLLITGGTESSGGIVPAGLYAYDGVSWHQLSDVCGSAEGRIAYVSADEWWTISDQRPGLGVADQSDAFYDAISLCHFVNGVVVGSYALPIEQSDSWPQMDAAACDGPDDCWFAGAFSGTTDGAFHLYWNGQTLAEVDNTTEEHAVSSMAVDDGEIYEGVTIGAEDSYANDTTETATDPFVIHSIDADDLADPFGNVVLADNDCTGYCPTLPEYGSQVTADDYGGWLLSSDAGSVSDPASPDSVWALAAPTAEGANAGAQTIVLHDADGDWTQIVGDSGLIWPAAQKPAAIAAVPGQNAAWVTLATEDNIAHLELLSSSDGGTTWSVGTEQNVGPDQDVGDLGGAGPISCPAANDCWMATSQGWLFQWTDGSVLPQSTDPVYNGGIGVITYRPADDGVPNVPGVGQPPDDSLANQAPPQVITTPGGRLPAGRVALVTDEKATMIKGTEKLRFTFKLRAKARVQLIAQRRERPAGNARKPSKKGTKAPKGKLVTVARSKRETLNPGKRSLIITLNPKRWPTSLKLDATPLKPTKKKRLGR